MIRIALVNDVRMAIEALRRAVTGQPELEIAWIAEDGQQALEKCRADRPDLILMDLIMPVMDGVEATRQIMHHCPCPILVVTATVTGNAGKVYEALGHGAVDAVNTPVLGRDGSLTGASELVRKIRSVICLYCSDRNATAAATPVPPPPSTPSLAHERFGPYVLIGASTGGPQAISRVLGDFGAISFPVFVVQHLDQSFVPGLAEWLRQETGLPVELVESGQTPQGGTVYLANTADHMVMGRTGRLDYTHEPAEAIHRPSVDVFFDSMLSAPVRPGVAVLLTGMGRDGAAALAALRGAGWQTIAQDEATSIIWGMPGAAVRLDAADQVLPLPEIGAAVTQAMSNVNSKG